MLPPVHPYHQHPDGTFQIDRYRLEATAMRREALRSERKAPVALKLLVVAAVMLAVGVVVAPPKADNGTVSASLAAGQAASNPAF